MSRIEAIVEELKILPREQLEQAAAYIHRLRQINEDERMRALRATSGALTRAEADDWARIIEDCERIDDSGW